MGSTRKADPSELRDDMQLLSLHFDEAAEEDPTFVDAKIGALSCLAFLRFPIPKIARGPRVQG